MQRMSSPYVVKRFVSISSSIQISLRIQVKAKMYINFI